MAEHMTGQRFNYTFDSLIQPKQRNLPSFLCITAEVRLDSRLKVYRASHFNRNYPPPPIDDKSLIHRMKEKVGIDIGEYPQLNSGMQAFQSQDGRAQETACGT